MPKIVKEYGIAICRAIKTANGAPYSPSNWRMKFLEEQGELLLCESLYKNPGGLFLRFIGADWSEERQDFDDWRLKTYYGEERIEGNILTFKTKNSIYTFELLEYPENKTDTDKLIKQVGDEFIQKHIGALRGLAQNSDVASKENMRTEKMDNELSMDLIDKWRFANAIREAISCLDRAAGYYRLTKEPYYLEIKEYLENKAANLEMKKSQMG